MAIPAWHTLARSLHEAGDVSRAFEVLATAVAEGNSGALVVSATLKWKHGHFHEADELMASAERLVSDDDWEMHFAMHVAYAMGVVQGAYEARQHKAFEHLLAAASASGDPQMKHSVGLHYWQALNGVVKDIAAAEFWLGEAATSGIPDIVASYKQFLQQKKRYAKIAT